jgi:hypothetical protein
MATSGRGTSIVGYNVQVAVDTQHHLIMAHQVVSDAHDRTRGTNVYILAIDREVECRLSTQPGHSPGRR